MDRRSSRQLPDAGLVKFSDASTGLEVGEFTFGKGDCGCVGVVGELAGLAEIEIRGWFNLDEAVSVVGRLSLDVTSGALSIAISKVGSTASTLTVLPVDAGAVELAGFGVEVLSESVVLAGAVSVFEVARLAAACVAPSLSKESN